MLADPEDTQFLAAASGTAAEVKAALSAGADPGARNEGGATPLHVAAMRNADPAVIAAPLEGGADPGARDEGGKVPFYHAMNPARLPSTLRKTTRRCGEPTSTGS